MSAYKIIKSGHIIEVYEYEKLALPERETQQEQNGGRHREGKKERAEEYRATVNYRAREKCRRMINANFTNENDLFITLTYKENMQSVEQGNKDFKQFMQKMNRRFAPQKLKYLAVIEFQKRGAVHYHMLCNFPITWEGKQEREQRERELASIWGHGFCDIIDVKQVDNLGAYLLKYMQKNFTDTRLNGKKRYLFSKTLVQPEVIDDDRFEAILGTIEGLYPKYTSSYYNDFTGQVQYREYNLKWGLSIKSEEGR